MSTKGQLCKQGFQRIAGVLCEPGARCWNHFSLLRWGSISVNRGLQSDTAMATGRDFSFWFLCAIFLQPGCQRIGMQEAMWYSLTSHHGWPPASPLHMPAISSPTQRAVPADQLQQCRLTRVFSQLGQPCPLHRGPGLSPVGREHRTRFS